MPTAVPDHSNRGLPFIFIRGEVQITSPAAVDITRLAPAAFTQRWGDYRQEIDRNGSGSIITGPVRGSRLYFLNGRVWWNDPDPTYVRTSVPLSQARLITSWAALSGQFYLNSDWLPQSSAWRG